MSPCEKRVELGLKLELGERTTNGLGIMLQARIKETRCVAEMVKGYVV